MTDNFHSSHLFSIIKLLFIYSNFKYRDNFNYQFDVAQRSFNSPNSIRNMHNF